MMTNNYAALAGTTNLSFRIGSFTIYQGGSVPSFSANNGDLYIQSGSTSAIYQYVNNSWEIYGSSSNSSSFTRTKITTTSYTANNSETYIGASLPNTVIYLPAGTANKTFTIKDESGQAFVHPLTIVPNGSDTIDGNSTESINVNYGSINLIYGDSGWFIF